jgi:hypothetical protein
LSAIAVLSKTPTVKLALFYRKKDLTNEGFTLLEDSCYSKAPLT